MKRETFLWYGATWLLAGTQKLLGQSSEPEAPCKTGSSGKGPFYRSNPPWRTELAKDLPGDRIQVGGHVFSSDCQTPVKDAVVDVWHADTFGDYDNHSNSYRYRGRTKTDQRGYYFFDTIYPGSYGPPRHIHYMVTAPDHEELVTQLYFEGDRRLKRWGYERDSVRPRIGRLVKSDIEGAPASVTFNIYLARTTISKG